MGQLSGDACPDFVPTTSVNPQDQTRQPEAPSQNAQPLTQGRPPAAGPPGGVGRPALSRCGFYVLQR